MIAFHLDLFGDLSKMHGEVPFLVAIKLGISFGLCFFEVRASKINTRLRFTEAVKENEGDHFPFGLIFGPQ